jgi:O-methyltransferase
MNPVLRLFKSLFKKINYDLKKIKPFNLSENFPEASEFEKELLNLCSNYSMTGHDRMHSLIKSIEYIKQNNVDGDFVECGVWKGGNLIIFQKYVEKFNLNKKIYAYDTFEGMSQPTEIDKTFEGESASSQLEKLEKKNVDIKKNILIED